MTRRFLAALMACAGVASFAPSDGLGVESQAEIQINLCTESARVIRMLRLAEKGKPTSVWLFDTPSLSLNQQGLRLRLRERGKHTELTLKVAGQNCAKVDTALLKPDGKCEADLHGDAFDDVISLSREVHKRSRAALLAAETGSGAPLVTALSAALDANQRTLLSEQRGVARGSSLLPPDLKRLGPSAVRAYASASQPYVVEVWTLPGGQQFIELSQKVRRDSALVRRSDLQQQLTAAGVAICPDQDSQARNKLALMAR